MIQLHTPEQKPYFDIPYIGVVIKEVTENQRHIGLLFRTDKQNEPKMLHLAFHYRLQCEQPSGYWLHCSGFDEDEQLLLAVWFENVWLVNKERIPYGLAYSSNGYFDVSGTFVQSNKNCGLTCATFVMALFNDFGFQIINVDTWESRDSDSVWQNDIVTAMKRDQDNNPKLYSKTHIQEQVNNIGIAVRFRPEEVAASAYVFDDVPVSFQTAAKLGKDVLLKMGLSSGNPINK